MVLVIIQARMDSTRLPGKVMMKIRGKPLLYYVINQIRGSCFKPNIIVATTNLSNDDVIASFSESQNVKIFRGNEIDVLDRFYQCTKKFNDNTIIRICADSPFIDYNLIDECFTKFEESNIDYLSNTIIKHGETWKEDQNGYPLGTAVEVFSFDTLEKAWKESKSPYEREHVTDYIIKHPKIFRLDSVQNFEDFSHYRIVVDYKEDFELANKIINNFPEEHRFSIQQVISFLKKSTN